MKKTFVLAVCLFVLAGCGKHSLLAPPAVVSSIAYYDITQHRATIESFAYNGAQLTTYTNQIIDSMSMGNYWGPWSVETEVYRFQYQDSSVRPVSLVLSDTLTGPGYIGTPTWWMETYVFRYDGQGRMILDSLTSTTDTSTCCGPVPLMTWVYSGSGIGVYFRYHTPSLVSRDSVVFNSAGDASSYYDPGTLFSSVRNPLYNSPPAGTVGPFFFDAAVPVESAWLPFRVDFLSKNLPVSAGSPVGNDYRLLLTWQTGPNGRVSGGTVTDMFVPTNATDSFFGPVKISYSYQ